MKNRKSFPLTVLPLSSGKTQSSSSIRGSAGILHPVKKSRKVEVLTYIGILSFFLTLALGVVFLMNNYARPEAKAQTKLDPDLKKRQQRETQQQHDQPFRLATDLDEESNSSPVGDPLQAFPTVSSLLTSFDIVALYFAASWCPMSTPVTHLLDDLFREVVTANVNTGDFAILYVSSDRDEKSFQSYIQQGWKTVPYHSHERDELKRYYATAARREMEDLSMQTRKNEIPALLIISRSGKLLTQDGVQDIREMGVAALKHWQELQELQRMEFSLLSKSEIKDVVR